MWRQRKRIWCGLPWTFTVYSFDEERLFIDSGVLTKRQDEIRLYRVLDISVTRTLSQRMFGMGTIHLKTSDKTIGDFDMLNIKKVMEVKEQLSEYVENCREKKRVTSREFMVGEGFAEDDVEDLEE